MKKLLTILMALTLAIGILSASAAEENTGADLSNCTNVARGKTVYGVRSQFGIEGEGPALVDGDPSTFVFAFDFENWADPIAAFVIDLGENYEKYNVKQIDITTLAEGMWPGLHTKNWTAWLADGYSIYEGKYYYRRGEMLGLGGIEVGTVTDPSAAANGQVTFKLPINTTQKKRYVIISHEAGDGVTSKLSLADVAVWAEEEKEEVDLSNCTNVALGKKAYGGQALYGSADSSALVDGSKLTWTWMSFPEGRMDPSAAFVIDLGENYENYSVKQISITTVPDGAWVGRSSRNYTAWLASNYLVDNGAYYYRKSDMSGIDGIEIGTVDDYSAAEEAQVTFKFSTDTKEKRRYVIISHEPNSNPLLTSYLALSEVEVWAETNITKVDNKNIAPLSEISLPSGDNRELAKALIDGDTETAYTGTESSVVLNFGNDYTIIDYSLIGGDNAVVTFSEDGETYSAFEMESYYRYAKIDNAAGVQEVRILADPAEYSYNVAMDCRFTDSAEAGGNTITDLKRNVIGAECDVINLTAVEQEAYVILAKYSAGGKLMDINIKSIKIAGYGKNSVTASVTGDGANAQKDSSVKCMIFKQGSSLNLDKYFELIN